MDLFSQVEQDLAERKNEIDELTLSQLNADVSWCSSSFARFTSSKFSRPAEKNELKFIIMTPSLLIIYCIFILPVRSAATWTIGMRKSP